MPLKEDRDSLSVHLGWSVLYNLSLVASPSQYRWVLASVDSLTLFCVSVCFLFVDFYITF